MSADVWVVLRMRRAWASTLGCRLARRLEPVVGGKWACRAGNMLCRFTVVEWRAGSSGRWRPHKRQVLLEWTP